MAYGLEAQDYLGLDKNWAKNNVKSGATPTNNQSKWWGTGGYLDIGTQALGTLGSLYLGSQQLSLGKRQFDQANEQFGMNWGAQAKAFNLEMSKSLTRDLLNQGYDRTTAEAMAAQQVAQRGIPETVADAKRVFSSPSQTVPTPPANTQYASIEPRASSQPGMPQNYTMNYGG